MISIYEKTYTKEHPKPGSMAPPPWVTIPALGGVAAVGGYALGKKIINYPVKKVKELQQSVDKSSERDRKQFEKSLETHRERGLDYSEGEGFNLLKKLRSKYDEFSDKMNEAIALGLFYEMKKVKVFKKPIKQIYKGAAINALTKGQHLAINDPTNIKRVDPYRKASANLLAGATR